MMKQLGFKLDYLQKQLESLFYRHGKLVSKHPLPFLVIPIIITVGLSLGMISFTQVSDAEYLYAPKDGPTLTERTTIQNTFPENDSYYFEASRRTVFDGYMYVIITASQTAGNVFTPIHMQKIIQLNNDIISMTIEGKTYLELCSSWKGTCRENTIISILNGSGNTIDLVNISYPLHNSQYFMGKELGGVLLNSNGYIQSVEAVQLAYNLCYLSPEDVAVSMKWFHKARDLLSNYNADGVVVDFQYGSSVDEELEKAISGIIPKFAITYTVLMSFSVLTCMMLDWVRTKIWFAIGGELCAGMAVVTSLGLLSAAGVPFVSPVGIMPFLIIGIGIDDMFMMLAAWRHTSVTLPVDQRMALTFKTAAISITVTSATDALAFLVGSLSNFRSVTIFCAYTGVAVIFSYIYAITFLAAILYYSGQREAQNKHELTCRKILPAKLMEHKSYLYKLFCTGGDIIDEMEVETSKLKENKLHLPLITDLIREKFAPFIMASPVKVIIILSYCVYLGTAVWGCTLLKDGLKITNLAQDSSYIIPFFDKQFSYFNSKYGIKLMIAYTDSIDYCDTSIREEIVSDINTFRNSKYFFGEPYYVESWLYSFLQYLNITSQTVPSDMKSFITLLKSRFLTVPPYDKFATDVVFNSDNTKIIASRFFILSKGFRTTLEEREIMLAARQLGGEAARNITIFHPLFIYTDAHTIIVSSTLQNLGIATASMLLVSLLLLPSFISVMWVTLSVISICTGVVGFMVLWDVNLDSISMIHLIIGIGFSVDFSAHISYQFCISKFKTGNKRAIDSLGHLGTPIIQGAVSTILGAMILSTSDTYIFRTFFKIILLVMLFGFAHAFFVLPVVLSLVGPHSCFKNNEDKHDGKYFKQHPVPVTNVFQLNRIVLQNNNFHKPAYLSEIYVIP